jgi:hypothetical protein
MKKTKEQHEKLAKLLDAGTPVCAALEQAGWSPNQAAKGTSKIPQAVYGMLSKKAKGLIKLGRETGKDDRKALVRGRLIENVTRGSDKGALSAKILGSDSELNLWQPEVMTGVIVLNAPRNLGPLVPPEDDL